MTFEVSEDGEKTYIKVQCVAMGGDIVVEESKSEIIDNSHDGCNINGGWILATNDESDSGKMWKIANHYAFDEDKIGYTYGYWCDRFKDYEIVTEDELDDTDGS